MKPITTYGLEYPIHLNEIEVLEILTNTMKQPEEGNTVE